MFGQSQDPDATIFAAVRRLPAAHTLSFSSGELEVKRYWTLRAPDETETLADPTGELEALLQSAVDDRLRDTDSAGISLSGGIDSPLIAAIACGRHGGSARKVEVRAESVVFDRLIPDDEKQFATIAAAALEIPIGYRVADDYELFGGRDDGTRVLPEPPADPTAAITEEMMRSFAEHGRVALTGYDGDALCQTWLPSHFRRLLGSGQLLRVPRELRQLSRLTGHFPPKGITGLQAPHMLRQARRRAAAEFPHWLDADLVGDLNLVTRWQRIQAPHRSWSRPNQADAIELLTGPGVRDVLESYDPVITGAGVDVRHPLFDLRVINFMLTLPPIPWKVDKAILRQVAGRSLPASISSRSKTPLAADPIEAKVLSLNPGEWPDSPTHTGGYLSAVSLPSLASAAATGTLWPRIWVTGLDLWLSRQGTGT
jgi:asparagine synthase (glutamine-hydrolysing)